MFFLPSVAFLHQQRSSGDIMIRNIQPKHAGKYTCAVQTKVDSVSIATDVVVRGKCDPCCVMMAEAEECKGSVVTRVKLLTRCFCSAQVSEYVSDTISRECVEAGACVLATEQAEILVKNAEQAAARAELGNYANDP